MTQPRRPDQTPGQYRIDPDDPFGPQPVGIAVSPGSSSRGVNLKPHLLTFQAAGIISGVYGYDPSFGAGNLAVSLSFDSFDPFGNPVARGIAAYDNLTFSVLNPGGVVVTHNTLGTIGQITYDAVTPGTAHGTWFLQTPHATFPLMMSNFTGVKPGTSDTIEAWNSLSLAAGPAWTAAYARYAWMPFGVGSGSVWVNASLTSGTTVADGTTIATLPASYQPTTGPQLLDAASNDEPPNGGQTQHFEVDTSGNVKCYGIAASSKTYLISGFFPLD